MLLWLWTHWQPGLSCRGTPALLHNDYAPLILSCGCARYYAPNRDVELVRRVNTKPVTWADFLDVTGFDGTPALPELRGKLLQRN